MYKLGKPLFPSTETNCVIRLSDGSCIPFDPNNSDYVFYLKWLDGYEFTPRTGWVKTSESNTPLPADE